MLRSHGPSSGDESITGTTASQVAGERSRTQALDTGIRMFSKGGKTGGVDSLTLLNELMQHHLSQLAEQWHRQNTGYVIGSRGDDLEVRTVLSHLCWVDNIWLIAHDTTVLQAVIGESATQVFSFRLIFQSWNALEQPKSMQVMHLQHSFT